MKRFSGTTGHMLAIVALASIALLAACQDPVGTLFGGRPSDVEATQGDYSDRIDVTWTGVADKQSGEDTIRVLQYEIWRREGISGEEVYRGFVAATTTVFVDTAIQRGLTYTYRVNARFENNDTSIQSAPATGYALMTTLLSVYSGRTRTRGARTFDTTTTAAGGEAWFDFAGQAGWVYRVAPVPETGSGPTEPAVSLYRKGDIETVIAPIRVEDGSTFYRLPRTGFFHAKLEGGKGSVSVSHQ